MADLFNCDAEGLDVVFIQSYERIVSVQVVHYLVMEIDGHLHFISLGQEEHHTSSGEGEILLLCCELFQRFLGDEKVFYGEKGRESVDCFKLLLDFF